MRLLADESLTARTWHFLRTLGHELLTLNDLGRLGVTNGEVLALAKTHHAILIAEDRGLGNLLTYPLGTHDGIIVLKIRAAQDIDAVHRHLRDALTAIPPNELVGCLLIVDPNKYRLRRPT